MEQYSLTEILLDRLMDQTGLAPQGDLVDRLRRTPPAVLRGLRSLDADTVGLAATLPLDLAPALAEMLREAIGDDGRFDRARADAYMAAQAARDEDAEDEDADAPGELMAMAHEALGLDAACAECGAWLAARSEEEVAEDADEHGHHEPESLLGGLFERHPGPVDAWEPQMALRIARDAANLFGGAAGFNALHEVVAHGGGAPGLSREGLVEAHGIQHVGMGLCEDAAQVQAFRVALSAIRSAEGVTAGIAAAERAAVEDAVGLAGIPGAVAVGLLAQQIEGALVSAPVPPPARRLPKKRRR